MKDETFYGLKPIRAKFTDPFYSVDEESMLNGWINTDHTQVRGNFVDEQNNHNSVLLRKRNLVHYVHEESNAYLDPESGVVFVCSDDVMTVWNSKKEKFISKYTKVSEDAPFYVID